jgi:hypothetical protein
MIKHISSDRLAEFASVLIVGSDRFYATHTSEFGLLTQTMCDFLTGNTVYKLCERNVSF